VTAAARPAAPVFRAIVALHGTFLLSGSVTVVLGPLVPALEARWRLPHAQTGTLFVAQFAASSLGALLSGQHLRRSLVGGWSVVALGLAGLASCDWPWARAAMALVGFGLGLSIPATNLLVAHLSPGGRAASLSRLNLVWGIGAVGSPLLFAALSGRAAIGVVLGALAAAAAIAATVLARAVSPSASLVSARGEQPPRIWGPRIFVVLGALLFLYVGTETTVGGWVVALAAQVTGERTASLLVGAGFWGALLVGRGLAPILLRRVSEPQLHGFALALSGAGLLTLLLATSRSGITSGALLAGAGLAPLFPLIVSAVAGEAETAGSGPAGPVFAMAGLGAACVPWLAGHVADREGALRLGFLVPVGAVALMSAISLAFHAFGSLPSRAGGTHPDGPHGGAP
jgi:FHS family glucose/mannose:H+ symporter-like MFS transporter